MKSKNGFSFYCVSLSAIAFLLLFSGSAFGQLNTFDGKSVEVEALSAGGDFAYRFGGNPTVKRIEGTSQISVYDCANSFLGNITDISPLSITRDSTTGYWCFKTSDTKVKVEYSVGSNNYSWIWLANTNSTGFYNVKDFGALGNGHNANGTENTSANDTTAIKNAVVYTAAKLGGTLYFPEGVYPVTSSISLPPGIIIKGTSGLSSEANLYVTGSYSRSSSTIVLRGDNLALFKIGEGVNSVKIESINLKANSQTGTYGVEAIGTTISSQRFTFDNVAFSRFDKGIYVHNPPNTGYNWQFDYIHVNRCFFVYNKSAGIHVSTYNTDWRISSSLFLLTATESQQQQGTYTRSDGIVIEQGGAFLVENSFGGGLDYTNQYRGGTFIKVTAVGSLTVLNSSSERASGSVEFGTNAGNLSSVLTLINNNFGDPMNINGRVNFVSTGNFYLGKTVNTTDKVRIFSTGDRFCYDINIAPDSDAPCGRNLAGQIYALDQAGFQGTGTIVFQTGQPTEKKPDGSSEISSLPMKIKGDVEVKGNEREINTSAAANSRPILSVTVDNDGGSPLKPLVRLGHDPYVYDIVRDNRGWLKFSGAQSLPYRGFYFEDAPFQLPSFTLAQITSSDFGTAQSGTVVYCSNCQKNTSPCQSGGSGALALLNGTPQWDCK